MVAQAQEYWTCPRCEASHPVHAFKLFGQFLDGWRQLSERRRCPSCGEVTPFRDFRRSTEIAGGDPSPVRGEAL
jgi:rubredoxin